MCWAPLEHTRTKSTKKLSLHKIVHLYNDQFANGHIFLQTALKFTGYAPICLLCNLYSKDALLKDDLSRFFKS